jgi:hypothetical protein
MIRTETAAKTKTDTCYRQKIKYNKYFSQFFFNNEYYLQLFFHFHSIYIYTTNITARRDYI